MRAHDSDFALLYPAGESPWAARERRRIFLTPLRRVSHGEDRAMTRAPSKTTADIALLRAALLGFRWTDRRGRTCFCDVRHYSSDAPDAPAEHTAECIAAEAALAATSAGGRLS